MFPNTKHFNVVIYGRKIIVFLDRPTEIYCQDNVANIKQQIINITRNVVLILKLVLKFTKNYYIPRVLL
jgi:hypothetical protein